MIDEEKGNMAQTMWQRLSREEDRTRVDFTPITGRTHQVPWHFVLHIFCGANGYAGLW